MWALGLSLDDVFSFGRNRAASDQPSAISAQPIAGDSS
jgi:hypothetical protein